MTAWNPLFQNLDVSLVDYPQFNIWIIFYYKIKNNYKGIDPYLYLFTKIEIKKIIDPNYEIINHNCDLLITINIWTRNRKELYALNGYISPN